MIRHIWVAFILSCCVSEVVFEAVDEDASVVGGSEVTIAVPMGAYVVTTVGRASSLFEPGCFGIGSNNNITVVIGYEDCADKGSGLNATNIAYLANKLINDLEINKYPNIEDIREYFDDIYVIAAYTEDGLDRSETMARIKYPVELGDEDAFSFPAGNYELAQDGRFIVVFGSHILRNRWGDIVLHELKHGALHIIYGDADPRHERRDVWDM